MFFFEPFHILAELECLLSEQIDEAVRCQDNRHSRNVVLMNVRVIILMIMPIDNFEMLQSLGEKREKI